MKPSLTPGAAEKAKLETRQYYGAPCSGGRICMPMSDCHQMTYEAAKACYTGDQSLFCGGSGYEPYVCCPKSSLESSQMCGKSLVSGQFYKGLGSFPFVARVGFKSKWLNIMARYKSAATMPKGHFVMRLFCCCCFFFSLLASQLIEHYRCKYRHNSISVHWVYHIETSHHYSRTLCIGQGRGSSLVSQFIAGSTFCCFTNTVRNTVNLHAHFHILASKSLFRRSLNWYFRCNSWLSCASSPLCLSSSSFTNINQAASSHL